MVDRFGIDAAAATAAASVVVPVDPPMAVDFNGIVKYYGTLSNVANALKRFNKKMIKDCI